MKQFSRYFRNKMKDTDFKTLYEMECNVCAQTMRIFEKADLEKISISSLASAIEADAADLEALRDADKCDLNMVLRLCRHLGLPTPNNCPKLNNPAESI